MSTIRVSTRIGASPSEVWDVVRDIGTHAEWMRDAEAIRFTTAQQSGVGTAFDCDTRLGPLRITDRMEVTEWEEGRTMGIRHSGAVTGTGRFTLAPAAGGDEDGGTEFTWEERLLFPWWMGGALGSAVAAPIFRWVWSRNLAGLRQRVESGQ